MRTKVVWFRASLAEEQELSIARNYFHVSELMTAIPHNSIVIARYSVLPFYKEVEQELAYIGCSLLNSYTQHMFAADARRYASVLGNETPKVMTLQQAIQAPETIHGYVLKGSTNSRKHLWNTHMFAANKQALKDVYGRLLDDSLISQQDIVIKEFIPLAKAAENGMNGLPISHEVRVFFFQGRELARGFYWSDHDDDNITSKSIAESVPAGWLKDIIVKLSDHIPFGVVDVAKTAAGNWIVIEVNDAQMSGLSCVNPNELYERLCNYIYAL